LQQHGVRKRGARSRPSPPHLGWRLVEPAHCPRADGPPAFPGLFVELLPGERRLDAQLHRVSRGAIELAESIRHEPDVPDEVGGRAIGGLHNRVLALPHQLLERGERREGPGR
jgi:hypothetical protein